MQDLHGIAHRALGPPIPRLRRLALRSEPRTDGARQGLEQRDCRAIERLAFGALERDRADDLLALDQRHAAQRANALAAREVRVRGDDAWRRVRRRRIGDRRTLVDSLVHRGGDIGIGAAGWRESIAGTNYLGSDNPLEGIEAHSDDVVVTTGSQQALDLVTRVFVNPGDVVVAEAPSYVGALGVFRAYQADVVHVPLDEHGLIPAALEETLAGLAREGRLPDAVMACVGGGSNALGAFTRFIDEPAVALYGVEAAAREARYAVYRAQAVDNVVLAHHQDDQAETVLMRLVRGAGPGAGRQTWRPLERGR